MRHITCIITTAVLAFAPLSFGKVSVSSPVFENRNTTHVASLDHEGYQYMGLKTVDGGMEYASAEALQAPAQSPASLTPSSVCLASGCAGSVCLGSACAGSACLGSVCKGSACLLSPSACVASGCLGSVCSASVCTGSVCTASVCVGSVCKGSVCNSSSCNPPKKDSFELVNGLDYRVEANRVVLTVTVSDSAQLVSGAKGMRIASGRQTEVSINGSFRAVSVSSSGANGAEITLTDATGQDVAYVLRRA